MWYQNFYFAFYAYVSMHITHVALWTNQLETMKAFYEAHFAATSNEKYVNPAKNFASYFLTFASGAKLKLMQQPGKAVSEQPSLGYAHIAISLGSPENVDRKTKELEQAGYSRLDGPRTTGDGYYESTFADPDGNVLELTA